MYEPEWLFPAFRDEIASVLRDSDGRASIIAGGTDLAPRIRSGEDRPGVLVDITRVEELGRLSVGERIDLGATVTHARVASDAALAEAAPVLADACRVVGSPQIRSRGTVGGNAANASPAADAVTALLALDADVVLESTEGPRAVALADFLRGPGQTNAGAGEYLTHVSFARPPRGARGVYLKAGQRNAMAIAIASVAAVYEPEAGRVRIALGSVAPTAVRATGAETLFAEGAPGAVDRDLVVAVAKEATAAASCIDDVRASSVYRTILVRALTERALETICLS